MKIIRTLLITALVALPLAAAENAVESWGVDKVHSSATFKIRHLMSNVTGEFNDFDAIINMNRANPAASSVEFTIQAASIDTRNKNRDEHLRSPDFFEVAKYPTITFKSTAVKPKSATEFDVTGDLTVKGVTKRITLPVTFLGFGKDGRGNEKAGFEIETTINRKDYGVTWNRTLDEGGILLGEDVKVAFNLQVAKKK